MTSTPIYVLLSNDGDEDQILTSNVDLRKKLAHIAASNMHKIKMMCQMDPNNPPPITRRAVNAHIADVTATHNLFVHRRFVPYVAMFHSFYATQQHSGSFTLATGGSMQFDLEYAGEFYNKVAIHATFSAGTAVGHKWAWAPFLGHKWLKQVDWKVNTQVLDTYDSHIAQTRFEFDVDESKKDAYCRCIGQEVPKRVRIIQDNPVANGGSLGDPTLQEYAIITDGPQTPKVTQPQLEMFIPTWFWWNLESEESFCSLRVPNGQRSIVLTFETLANLVQFYDLVPTLTTTANTVGYNAAFWAANSAPTILNLEALVQNIFVNPEICDIYVDKVGFNMVRLHRYQEINVQTTSFNEKLSMMKWPMEELRILASPARTPPAANPSLLLAEIANEQVEDWATYGFVNPKIIPLAGRWHSPATTANATRAIYKEVTDVIDSLSLVIQGTKLYDNVSVKFFTNFLPARFAEHNNRAAPKASGHILINFNAKPGMKAPNGHLNISRAKDIYLAANCSKIGSTANSLDTQVTIRVQGFAINFTFVTNGNIIIRYIG